MGGIEEAVKNYFICVRFDMPVRHRCRCQEGS